LIKERSASSFERARFLSDLRAQARPTLLYAHRQCVARGFACPSSRRACAWLIGWNEGKTAEKKNADLRRFVETLGRIKPKVAVAGNLARHLLGLIRRREVGGFDHWLVKASDCAPPELRV